MAGSRPGQRRGGRKKGVPNKATVERERQALEALRREAEVLPRRVWAKDELERLVPKAVELGDFVSGAVRQFQIVAMGDNGAGLPGQPGYVPSAWDRLREWVVLLKDVRLAEAAIMHKCADFQSPKFKAIAVVAAPPPDSLKPSNIRKIGDVNSTQRVYLQIVKGAAPERRPSKAA